MGKIQKIDSDSESKRYQRNMTNTQKRNSDNIKEGIIVNSFVKDPLLSLDETLDTLVISKSQVDLPQKLYEKEEKKDKKMLYLAGTSLGIMGIISGFSGMIKNFSKKKFESTEEYLLPGITRNHCINNEIDQSIFSMVQSPNRRTILSFVGVVTLASMAFIAKNFIDGCKDIWVKKQEANIQKNLQENLIEVETQAFSGKMQIIRSMLSSKAKIFSDDLQRAQMSNVNFKQDKKLKKQEDNKSDIASALFAGTILISIFTMGYLSLKNLKTSDKFIKDGIKNTKEGLKNVIKSFNEGKDIKPIEDHNGKILNGKDAYKHLIEKMLESIYANSAEVEEYINKMKLPANEKEVFIKTLKSSMNQATEKVNSAIGGSGRNKITYFSHVNDYLSFFYDRLMNPKNPQFKNLFVGITGISALAYLGKTTTEALKDVEVKKYSANIELDLQRRLVSTELRNFKAKKESVIEPLCKEFQVQKENGKSPDELKILADNILFEIKNGPPFVYS
ncbi:hypothetical protein IJO12_06445 [bacterium]|nr:hypothetical protein [bacterium]